MKKYILKFKKSVVKDLRKIPNFYQQKIISAIEALAYNYWSRSQAVYL
jgi:mRNA-degrading endonuclease RelE of RelBE toxin-antitoxin system